MPDTASLKFVILPLTTTISLMCCGQSAAVALPSALMVAMIEPSTGKANMGSIVVNNGMTTLVFWDGIDSFRGTMNINFESGVQHLVLRIYCQSGSLGPNGQFLLDLSGYANQIGIPWGGSLCPPDFTFTNTGDVILPDGTVQFQVLYNEELLLEPRP